MLRVGRHNAEKLNVSMMLQRGVYIEKPGTVTVSGFVCGLLGITLEIFMKDIKTLMLNNDVVDRPESTLLNSGDTLMLSGAMPGLVGAMLRSDSPLKSMRDSITAGDSKNANSAVDQLVNIKVFNTALAKYKEKIVDYGFLVKAADYAYFPDT